MDWWGVLLMLVSAVVGYGLHWARARVATRDNQDTIAESQKARALEHMRWAMDLLVDEDPRRQDLGADQLRALAKTGYLTDAELRLIRAANTSALEPLTEEWDNEQATDQGGEESP